MSELFRFDVNPWELIVRGTLMYMESEGEISVIRVDEEKSTPAKAHRQAGVK